MLLQQIVRGQGRDVVARLDESILPGLRGFLPKDANKWLDNPIEKDPYRNLYQLTQEEQ